MILLSHLTELTSLAALLPLNHPREAGETPVSDVIGLGHYFYDGFDLCRAGEEADLLICTANVEILEEQVLDDGASDAETRLKLGVTWPGGKAEGYCSAEAFFKDLPTVLLQMSSSSVVVRPNMTKQACIAIQLLSDPTRRCIYTHTGWREIQGEHVFLLPQGCLGNKVVETDIGNAGAAYRYNLPAKPAEPDVARAVQLARELLDVAPRHITWPLLSHLYSAPLSPCMPVHQRAVMHVVGVTGSWKTTLSTLFLCLWGDFSDGLPTETWASTPNYLGRMGFTLKDLPMLIDDYKPSMVRSRDVTRLVQNYADGTSRGRMNADSSLKTSYPIRAAILSTGEESLGVEASVAARVLSLCLSRSMINVERLTSAQTTARELAPATSAFLYWLRDHRSDLIEICDKAYYRMRDVFTAVVHAQGGGHTRIATSAATSAMGGIVWIGFLKRSGFIDKTEAREYEAQLIDAYTRLISSQLPEVQDQQADSQFILHLRAMISSGQVRIENRQIPLEGDQAKGQPPVVAYRDADGDYVHATAAVHQVKKFLASEGQRLDFGARAVYRQLDTQGLIQRGPNGAKTKVIRIGSQGRTVRVLHLPHGYLDETEE